MFTAIEMGTSVVLEEEGVRQEYQGPDGTTVHRDLRGEKLNKTTDNYTLREFNHSRLEFGVNGLSGL